MLCPFKLNVSLCLFYFLFLSDTPGLFHPVSPPFSLSAYGCHCHSVSTFLSIPSSSFLLIIFFLFSFFLKFHWLQRRDAFSPWLMVAKIDTPLFSLISSCLMALLFAPFCLLLFPLTSFFPYFPLLSSCFLTSPLFSSVFPLLSSPLYLSLSSRFLYSVSPPLPIFSLLLSPYQFFIPILYFCVFSSSPASSVLDSSPLLLFPPLSSSFLLFPLPSSLNFFYPLLVSLLSSLLPCLLTLNEL